MEKQVPVTQVADILEKAVADSDQARAKDLDGLSQVRAAKFAGLARDRARLVAKLGADSPRVAALDQNLALHQATIAGFRNEIALSSTAPPRVNQKSWVLHGNLFDASRAALQGLTVSLYQKDIWMQEFGFACTDANGYFVLTVEDATKPQAGALSLHVLKDGKTIYIDPKPVTLQAGHVEYREIIVGGADVCPPPSTSSKSPQPPVSPR